MDNSTEPDDPIRFLKSVEEEKKKEKEKQQRNVRIKFSPKFINPILLRNSCCHLTA